MQAYESEFHISDYIRIIMKRKAVMLTFFFTTVLVVGVYSFMAKPVYRATVTLLIDMESPNVLTTTGSVSLENINYYAYREYFQSQSQIIKGRSIARHVFEELKLGDLDEYKSTDDPIQVLQGKISVAPVPETRLLLLHAEDTDPRMAADVANRTAQEYVNRNLVYITQNEVINLHKNEYLKLQAKLSEYSKVYKHKHPKMIRLKEEIAQMAAIVRQEKAGVPSGEDVDDTIPSQDSYLSTSILQGLKANNVSIQDPAEVPIYPVRPVKRLNVLLSMIIGVFGGVGLAFFFEYVDDTVKGIDDLERLVKWPFLGCIPDINVGRNLSEGDKDLFVHKDPQDPVAEAYRTIRTSVLFSSTKEHPLKSIIITSPGPQEGKTTSACNLAITMAKRQKRVLLLDADMRRSRLHTIFGTENEIGLSNFLAGQADFDDLPQKTGIENLFLVSGGIHPPNPSELLASDKTEELIESAKEKFDFIMFDTAPMAVVTDAVVLSRVTDGAIIVLEIGSTSRRALPRMAQVLENAGAHVIGVILNKVSQIDGNLPYYSHYYARKQ